MVVLLCGAVGDRGATGHPEHPDSVGDMAGGESGGVARRSRHLEPLVLGVIVVVGAVLRIRQYVAARAMFWDEVALADNFVTLGFPRIVTEQLANQQSAPPGYLVATQASVRLFGSSEQALRLVALLAGIATVALAAVIAVRLLNHIMARVALVAAIALSPALIHYANEVKQYSSDALALMAVVLLWSLRGTRHAVWWLAAGGFVIALGSAPGIFGLVALGLALVAQRLGGGGRPASGNALPGGSATPDWPLRTWVIIAGSWLAGVGVHALYTLRAGVDRAWMTQWWTDRGAFPPDSLTSLGDLDWYPLTVMRLSWVGIGAQGRELASSPPTGPLVVTVIVVALVVIAFVGRRDLRAPLGFMLLVPWALAELRVYPTYSRLSVYLIPVIVVAAAAGFDVVLGWKRPALSVMATAAVGVLLAIQGFISVSGFLDPLDDRDMRWALAEVSARFEPGDLLVVPSGTKIIVDWYAPMHLAGDVDRLNYAWADLTNGKAPGEIVTDPPPRIWIVHSHTITQGAEAGGVIEQSGYTTVCEFDDDGTYLSLLVRNDLAASVDPAVACVLNQPR